MENALEVLEQFKKNLNDRGYHGHSFQDKLELVSEFLNNDLNDVIDALEKGINRVGDLESEVDELNEKIEELERESE